METKTKGIVIKTIKYGESSAICNILTEQYGLLGFHLQGVYNNKSNIKMSYLQALNSIEISFNYKKNMQLQRIKDIHCHAFIDLKNFKQRAFYLVFCELIQQTVKENEINPNLFQYLYDESLPALNEDIHFWQMPFVMLNVLHEYGCAPNLDSYTKSSYLDLQNGIFLDSLLPLKTIADLESSELIYQILSRGISHLPLDINLRQKVIDDLILYYKWHVSDHFDLKSRDVLLEMNR